MSTVVGDLFAGGSLRGTTFDGTSIKVTKSGVTSTKVVAEINSTAGFQLGVPAAGDTTLTTAPFFVVAAPANVLVDNVITDMGHPGDQCPGAVNQTDTSAETAVTAANQAKCRIEVGNAYEILGTNLITVDSQAPILVKVTTGHAWDASKKGTDRSRTGANAKKNSIRVDFRDPGKATTDSLGSGLDTSSVTPSAFTVSGNTVASVLAVDFGGETAAAPLRRVLDTVYLTLGSNLGSSEKPTVSVNTGQIQDKAGNAATGASRSGARVNDGLGPNLTLTKDSSLSRTGVTVSIVTDEQLSEDPAVTVKRINAAKGTLPVETVSGSLLTTTSLSYDYTVSASVLGSEVGGEFNVYVTGNDTKGTEGTPNQGSVGHKTDASNASAFIFELDTRLNGGDLPVVSVSDNEDVKENPAKTVEQVDPMIVTVDFSREGKEYDRDSYRTVELTSAKLRITFDDGATENRTFNLTTEVSSPDSVKFTIPLLNPKIGDYALTVQAIDQAGNVRIDGSGTTPQGLVATWEVVKPNPVDIALSPGWNLVSLPFQPANPAINSVINASHPADIVMTFDNAGQVWMVSRRDAETGLFVGDITVMTASTAYFIRTENFQAIRMLRPPLATAAAAPPPPPAITVVKGWNLVPVVSNAVPTPDAIAADAYFGTLRSGSEAGWLKALTFDTLVRTWISVSPGDSVNLGKGGTNPCTGDQVDPAAVAKGNEPCQIGQYEERSTSTDDIRVGDDDSQPGGDGLTKAIR